MWTGSRILSSWHCPLLLHLSTSCSPNYFQMVSRLGCITRLTGFGFSFRQTCLFKWWFLPCGLLFLYQKVYAVKHRVWRLKQVGRNYPEGIKYLVVLLLAFWWTLSDACHVIAMDVNLAMITWTGSELSCQLPQPTNVIVQKRVIPKVGS